MADYSWIAPLIQGVAKAGNSINTSGQASKEAQAAYQLMLDNLKARYAEYDQLPAAGYVDIDAEQLGPSALDQIQVNAQGQQAQQEAINSLNELAQNGGLSLADLKALNDIQANLNRNTQARQHALANDFAARGQLGAGAQLAMQLVNNQNAAQNANDRSESIAAQAQQRAMQAMLQKAGMARSMTNDDYQRQVNAARARDAINARNAANRTDVAKYGNTLRGQAYDDALRKLGFKNQLTKDMNEVVFNKGKNQSNTTLAQGGFRNDLIDQAGSFASKWGKGSDAGSGGQDETGDSRSAQNGGLDGYHEDIPDYSGGQDEYPDTAGMDNEDEGGGPS